jgi:hypothetical protein
VILARSRTDGGGRLARDKRDVAVLGAMQMAVSIFYAAVLGIALNVIEATGPVDSVVATIEPLLGLAER